MRMTALYRFVLRALYYCNSPFLYFVLRRLFARRLAKLLIHVNVDCNYDCRYCYVDKEKSTVSFEKWLQIIQEGKEFGVSKVSILGGEPFCYPRLDELVREISRAKMKPYIYTNGSLLTAERIEKLRPFNPVLVFKYDYNDETYRFHTRQEKFSLHDVEANIKLSVSSGLRVITFTTLLRKNFLFVDEIMTRSLRLGALPAFERYLPVKDQEANALLEITDEENAVVMRKIQERMKKYLPEWIAAVRIAGKSCGCYSDILSITPAGLVLPCPYLPEDVALGNIAEKTLSDIFLLLQKKRQTEYALPRECADCAARYLCAGGCLTYSYLTKKEFSRHCLGETAIGFCPFMLVDLFDRTENVISCE
jgi:radical SAM protein with 4Fe4S-binding SPASM domain